MKKKPLVSIIIRSKNEEKWISHCLTMIHKQSYKNFEIILVDNLSTDNTIKIAKRFNVKKIIKIKNFLPGKAINYGVKNSKGEYMVCLSAHCIPKNDNWLKILVSNLTNNSKVAAVYGRQIPISYSNPIDKRDLLITFGLDKRLQIKDNFFHNANSIFRKKIWSKIKFDEKVKNVEDRLWGKEIIKAGFNIVYEPDSIVYHHHGIHQNNIPERASSIVSIIEKFEKNRIKKLPEILKPENINIAAIVPYSIKSNNNISHKRLLLETIKHLKKSSYINNIYLISEKKIIQDKSINFINRTINKISKDVSLEELIYKSLKVIETKGDFPNSIMYVNYDYLFRPRNLIDNIIIKAQYDGYDTVFAASLDYGHYWIESEDGNFMQTDPSLKSREKRKPTFKALYGLGSLTSSHIIRNKKIIGGKIGIIPIDEIESTFRLREFKKPFFLKKLIYKNKK